MNRFLVRGISVVEYLLGSIMILGGIDIATTQIAGPDSALESVFSRNYFLFSYGALLLASGAYLIIAKIAKCRAHHSRALMAIFMLSLFAFFLEILVFGVKPTRWIDTIILSGVAAGCWIYWKLRTEYLDVERLRKRARRR